jgi:glucosamine 6-phosphate synthetase-like amidotransferase/phosphosugar isomerase protein
VAVKKDRERGKGVERHANPSEHMPCHNWCDYCFSCAYFSLKALLRGINPDVPRNLAKAVTVD